MINKHQASKRSKEKSDKLSLSLFLPLKRLNYLLVFLGIFSSCFAFGKIHSFGIIGDAGVKNENSTLVRKSILKSGITKLILPGDNLYRSFFNSYDDVWEPWKNDGFEFSVVSLGNHNLSYSAEMKFFNMPAEFFRKEIDRNLTFFILNSDNKKNVNDQISWLEKELSKTKSAINFLVYHHPSFTISKKHEWAEKKEFQLKLRPLLKKYRSKLTAVIAGHDHLGELLTFDDLPVIISGAVQEVRPGLMIDNLQDGVKVTSRWLYDEKPYWVSLRVDTDENYAEATFIRATDDARACAVKFRTGKSLDLDKNCLTQTKPPITKVK